LIYKECSDAQEGTDWEKIKEGSEMEKKTLKVERMSCEHCVKAVTNAIGGIAGVTGVVVSLKDKTASFSFDPAQTPLETIKAAITDEGYEIAATK